MWPCAFAVTHEAKERASCKSNSIGEGRFERSKKKVDPVLLQIFAGQPARLEVKRTLEAAYEQLDESGPVFAKPSRGFVASPFPAFGI